MREMRHSRRARGAILCVLACLLAAPLVIQAQPAGKVSRIGYLSSASVSSQQPQLNAFRQKLRELGYVEGRNIVIEQRSAEGRYERLPTLARELARINVDLIVTGGGIPSALAAKGATKTIPIVFFAGDPVASGIVSSLARPGGNLTGVGPLTAELDAKRLEILKEAMPAATRVAILWNPNNPTGIPQRNRMALAAEVLGVQLRMLEARSPSEIDAAFADNARERPDAMLVLTDPMLDNERKRIINLAARAGLPVVSGGFRPFAEAGGILTYGPSLIEAYRRLAIYADKILKGAKPADLPVEEPTKYELVINLKTAKALGLTIPQSLLVRADELIQ
jgi:putative ABC transport system substrate-binding protein